MDQKNIGIRFNGNDREIYDAIKEYFPDCQIIPSQEFEGIDVLWIAIIPIAGFGLQLLDFIFTHVIPKNSKDEQNKPNTDNCVKREIINDGNSLDADELVGKTKDEVSNTIKVKFGIELKFEIKTEKK